MPNFTLICPILLFLPVMILALVAMTVGGTHLAMIWLAGKPYGRVRPARLIVVAGQAPPKVPARRFALRPAVTGEADALTCTSS